ETELAELIPEWREEYEKANEPNFSYCTGHGWLRGEAAKRAHYRWAGIPPALVKKWDAERRRRAKTIRKLAESPADSGVAASRETDGPDPTDCRTARPGHDPGPSGAACSTRHVSAGGGRAAVRQAVR